MALLDTGLTFSLGNTGNVTPTPTALAGTSKKYYATVTSDIIDNSQNSASAIKAVSSAQSTISTLSATDALAAIGVGGAIGGIPTVTRTINIPAPTIADGIPSASTMLSVARKVEKAATELKETTIYNTYVTVFDTIKSIAQSGHYSYELILTPQQQAELTPLLTKYGYSVSLVNNANYNVSISWGASSVIGGGLY